MGIFRDERTTARSMIYPVDESALLRATFSALDSVINPFGCICGRERKVLDRARAGIVLRERCGTK